MLVLTRNPSPLPSPDATQATVDVKFLHITDARKSVPRGWILSRALM